jgi:hypothetical protein
MNDTLKKKSTAKFICYVFKISFESLIFTFVSIQTKRQIFLVQTRFELDWIFEVKNTASFSN